MCASTRPSSPFQIVDSARKRFCRLKSPLASDVYNASASGRIGLLCDEVVSNLMHIISYLPPTSLCSLDFRALVLEKGRDLTAFLLTCRRVTCVFDTTARLLKLEIAARASTQITPSDFMMSTPYPFTKQVELENVSKQQVNLLKEGVSKLALHCAGPCCESARAHVNR